MSTPTDPSSTATPQVPTPPPPLASSDDQIRQLATELGKPPYNFDPSTIRKANITAIDPGNATTPPTATILFSGDTTSPVSGVRLAAGYGPQVGDTVIVLKQGSDFFLLTDIAGVGNQTASSSAGGWTKATLNGAHSHNGNSAGDLMYRRTMQDGCWKMEWKGAINYGAGTTTVLSAALGSDFRPATKVPMHTARETASGGATGIGIDFGADGTVTIVGPTWSTNSSSSHTHSHSHGVSVSVSVSGGGGGSGGTGAGGTDGHTHSVSTSDSFSGSGSGSGGTDTDSTSAGSHSHTASSPGWISFHGIEYYLG